MVSPLRQKLAKDVNYLAITPMEQLYDEGIKFEGEDEKTQNLNHDDFVAARAIYTLLYNNLTNDGKAFLLRSMQMTLKPFD